MIIFDLVFIQIKLYWKILMNPYRSQVSSNPQAARRELLWNVSEPGDPYDIKKSMIGKIPGDKKVFMGDHLELVCLLQAAQIERLCEFLEDYKLKLRDKQRIVLDRHSYQVQIKELTQRLDDQTSKNQNTKYVDFIKRQQAEIQELQKNNRDSSDGIKQAYEKSLEMANYLNNQNQELRRQTDDMKLQLMNSVARYEALEKGKNKEIEDIKLFYSQSSKDQYQNNLNSLKNQYQGEIRKYDLELKRIKNLNQTKNSEISDLMAQREDLVRRMTANEGKADLQRQLYEYENKFVLFGQEIQRLNIALRDYTNKLEESDMKRRELERAAERNQYEKKELDGKIRSRQGQISHLNEVIRRQDLDSKKLGESQNYLMQYQQQISSLQRDLNDLSSKLKYESELSKKYKEEAEKLNYQLSKSKLLEKENYELRSQTEEIRNYRQKIAEAENKSAILKDEIQRLNTVIVSKDNDIERARAIYNENESLKVKTRDLETSLVSKYEYEISRVKSECEHKIELITRNTGSEIQGKSQIYQNQLQKMKESLKKKNEEAEKYRARVYELQTIINKNEIQVSSRYRTYENNIASLKRDNEEMYNKLRALGDTERKAVEFESRLSQYEREFERVNQTVKGKDEEIITLRNRLRETEGVSQRYQNDFGRKATVYEQTISSLRSQNDQIRKKLNDIINESNRKLQEASIEIDRLGKNFAKLQEEKNQLENQLRQISQRLENEKQENDNFRRQLTEAKTTISKYQGELSRVSSSMQQTLTNTGRQNQTLRKRLSDYQTKLTQFSQELDRLNKILKNKSQQYNQLEAKYKKLTSDYEVLMKQFKDYEIMVKNKYEGEVSQNYGKYQKTIANLKAEVQEWRKQSQDLEARNHQLHQEFSELVENLRRQLSHKDSTLASFDGETKRKISEYETNIIKLTRVNEELQKKVKELDIYAGQKGEEAAKLENLLKNSNSELENTRRRLQQVGGDTSRRLSEYELKYSQLVQERDKLIKRVEGYQSSISTYEAEVKRRFQDYENENEDLKRKLQESGNINRRLSEYESKMALMASQMERLHINLKSLSQENDTMKKKLSQKDNTANLYEMEVTRKLTILEQNCDSIQQENGDLKKKINDYEQRLFTMSQELQRVNGSLRNKNEDNIRLEQTIKLTYEQSLNQMKRDYDDAKVRIKQSDNRNAQLNQEIERLGQIINRKTQEIGSLQEASKKQTLDIEDWRRKYSDMELNFSQKYEVQVKNRIAKLQQTTGELRKENEEYRSKITGTMQQIERLNNILRLKVDESVQLTNKVNSLSSDIDDYRRKLRQTQNVSSQNFTTIKTERDELLRKIQDLETKTRQNDQNNYNKISEYQNKIRVMSQEMERLNQMLRQKNNDLEKSRRQFKEYKETISLEIKGNYGQYQTTMSNLNKQIQDLKKKLSESNAKAKEYQSKLVMTSHQIDRLDNMIKIKTQQLSSLGRDYDDLKRKWQDSSEVSRKIPEYEQKLGLLARENQKYISALKEKTEELNNLSNKLRQTQTDLESARRKINDYELELNKKVSNSEQVIGELRRENEEWVRRRGQYESKIALMSQELERVNSLLKTKNEEFMRLTQEYQSYKRTKENEYQDGYKTLNQNYTVVVNEYEIAKKHLIEYQESIRKLHSEFERLQSILTQLKKERDGLIDKNRVLSEEINRLNGENRDLEEQTKDIRLRLSDETALQKRISEHLGLMVVLFAEIETLRNRVREKEKEVVEVRKSSLAPHMV